MGEMARRRARPSQRGACVPDSKTAPEGAAVYHNIRANLLVLTFCVCWAHNTDKPMDALSTIDCSVFVSLDMFSVSTVIKTRPSRHLNSTVSAASLRSTGPRLALCQIPMQR